MPRAIWSGSIAFGLVNAPVKMYSAIDEHDLELHLVHQKDGSPIGYDKVCKKEGKKVPNDEIVKAYEVEDGELVYLTETDFKAAEDEVYGAIEVLDFVPIDEIDPIAFQRTYYLGPARGAEKVYALLVKAMSAAGLAAVTRYVFHDRQQLGVLRIRDGLITLENMYFADEIRSTDGILPEKRVRVDAKELEMAKTLIDTSFDRPDVLLVASPRHHAHRADATPTDLLEALRASVDAAKSATNGRAKKPARTRRRAKSKR